MLNYFDGIGKVVIYGNGKIYFQKTRDFKKVSNIGDIVSVNISEPKQARKENLSRKDNYYLNYTDEHSYYYKERKTALYIHVSEVSVSDPEERVSIEHDGEKDFLTYWKLNFKNGCTVKKLNCEKMLVPGTWTIPEDEKANGAHWKHGLGDHNNSYDTISEDEWKHNSLFAKKHGRELEKYNLVHWFYTYETISEIEFASDFYTRIEKDDSRKERETLAAALNSVLGKNSSFSHYDIAKLEKYFDIRIKDGVTF